VPLSGAWESAGFRVLGRPAPPPGQWPSADYAVVTPGFFDALRVPLRAGRRFDSRDRADAPFVTIVNEEFARRYFPNEQPLGQRIFIGWGSESGLEIVGIVGDVRQQALDAPAEPAMYFVQSQMPSPSLSFVVRAKGDPAAVLPLMRQELKGMDASLALHDVRLLSDIYADSMARQRFATLVIAVFAGAGLLLAVVGLYGVIAQGVAERTRELGVRLALGALPRDVMRLVLADGLRVTLTGLVAGLAGAFAVARLLRGLLFDVSPLDAPVYAAVATLLAAVSLLASYIPARRATRVDPVTALRGE
jgi:putative ABC transport system permease protein